MIISTTHKFVYCAVPKVASRTLRGLFEPLADEKAMKSLFANVRAKSGNLAFHRPTGLRAKMKKIGLDPDEFFWFGFVRNPWDRAVSRYYFEQARSRNEGALGRISSKHVSYHKSMIGLSWEEYLLEAPYFPQTDWLSDERGIAVDRIFRMEHLPTELALLGDILGCDLGIPDVHGATERERDYRVYYENGRQIEAVARYYAQDILLGGYRFDGSFGDSFDLRRLVSKGS
jgi:chondroitin 4-sulfotransferase 11